MNIWALIPDSTLNAMKHLRKILTGTLAAFIGAAVLPAAGAQKTFWSFAGTWTNGPTIVTNLNAAIDCTSVTDFSLSLIAYGTNNAGATGSFNVVWETSPDGANWPKDTNQISRSVGWFSIPVSSNDVKTVWTTNITMDAIGYWRLRHLTNAANMNYTNISIAGWIKPQRTKKDY
jgi:hypothetical protein